MAVICLTYKIYNIWLNKFTAWLPKAQQLYILFLSTFCRRKLYSTVTSAFKSHCLFSSWSPSCAEVNITIFHYENRTNNVERGSFNILNWQLFTVQFIDSRLCLFHKFSIYFRSVGLPVGEKKIKLIIIFLVDSLSLWKWGVNWLIGFFEDGES